MEEINYQPEHINLSRQALVAQVQDRVTKARFEHILRVESTAVKMAKTMDVDPELASIAALLHDYAKDMDKGDMLALAQKYWPQGHLERGNPSVWHGYAAAEIARQQLGVLDESILAAVSSHTIGCYEMDKLAKIIFVADYIEPGRDFKGVDQARKLAKKSIEQAMIYKMAESIQNVARKRQPIFEESVKIYNHWITQYKEEL